MPATPFRNPFKNCDIESRQPLPTTVKPYCQYNSFSFTFALLPILSIGDHCTIEAARDPSNCYMSSDTLLTALVLGVLLAATTATITYPFDSIKTQQQITNDAYMKKWHIPGNYPSSLAQLFRGCLALVVGLMMKTSTRIITYNWACQFMTVYHDNAGAHKLKPTLLRVVVAGAIAGFFELLWIIPFENIKILMIQNMLLANELKRCKEHGITYDITGKDTTSHGHRPPLSIFTRQYVLPNAYYTTGIVEQIKGKMPSKFTLPSQLTAADTLKIQYNHSPTHTFLGSIKELYATKGLPGFTLGLFVTLTRQVGNSVVWFWTYNAVRQLLDPQAKSDAWLSGSHLMLQSLAIHFTATLAVILATQPLDVVKTHMQLKNGKRLYRDSLFTAYKLFTKQGPRLLYKGLLPRWCKVLVLGGLTAGVYLYVERFVSMAGQKSPFTTEG